MKLEKEVQLYDYAYDVLDFAEGFTKEEREIIKQMHHKKVKLTLEVEELILDEAERKYLSNVIRPFRDRVLYIRKRVHISDEYIEIILKDKYEIFTFPSFEAGKMYKNMTIGKQYELEELGL